MGLRDDDVDDAHLAKSHGLQVTGSYHVLLAIRLGSLELPYSLHD